MKWLVIEAFETQIICKFMCLGLAKYEYQRPQDNHREEAHWMHMPSITKILTFRKGLIICNDSLLLNHLK